MQFTDFLEIIKNKSIMGGLFKKGVDACMLKQEEKIPVARQLPWKNIIEL